MNRKTRIGMRWAFLGFAVAFIIIGFTAHHAGWLAGLGIILLFLWAVALSSDRGDRALRRAPHGSTRVQTVKQTWVNQTVQRYASAGWQVVGQSSAKSFGSQARVTITFRKP